LSNCFDLEFWNANNPDYGVRALNLWKVGYTPYTSDAKIQSQLILVPEPDALILLAMSLIALLAVKVRFSLKDNGN
jgi:hypothetical protein